MRVVIALALALGAWTTAAGGPAGIAEARVVVDRGVVQNHLVTEHLGLAFE